MYGWVGGWVSYVLGLFCQCIRSLLPMGGWVGRLADGWVSKQKDRESEKERDYINVCVRVHTHTHVHTHTRTGHAPGCEPGGGSYTVQGGT